MDFAFDHAKTLCNKKQKHRTSDSLIFIFMFHSLQSDTFFFGEIYVVCELYIYILIINKSTGKVLKKKKCKHGLLVKLYDYKSITFNHM